MFQEFQSSLTVFALRKAWTMAVAIKKKMLPFSNCCSVYLNIEHLDSKPSSHMVLQERHRARLPRRREATVPSLRSRFLGVGFKVEEFFVPDGLGLSPLGFGGPVHINWFWGCRSKTFCEPTPVLFYNEAAAAAQTKTS